MRIKRYSILSLFLLLLAQLSVELAAQTACDEKGLAEVRQKFRQLRDLRSKAPDLVSDIEFRSVSERYVMLAEDCYYALYGSEPFTGQSIDDGGLWVGGPLQPRHNLDGRKWGANSPFLTPGSNPDATGPRSPGGEVTFSYMADGVDIGNDGLSGASCSPNCTNTSVFSFVFTDSGGDTLQAGCIQREIGDAFAAWSAIADITFEPVTDNGADFDAAGAAGDIRIGFHPFDGSSSTLAHAFFPPPNGTSGAGDLHFDVDETWSCTNVEGSIDIGIVALHEIGHSIGLRHETGGDTAVMNPIYNPTLNFGPAADDVIGAGEIYGGSPLGGHTFFGDVGFGTDTPQFPMHLFGTDGSNRLVVEEASSTPSARILFHLFNNGGSRFRMTDTGTGRNWEFTALANFNINFLGSPGQEMQVRTNGDLAILGSLIANGGTDTFPDYVFDDDYRLMPLQDLRSFIQTKKHLPNVPSARQVQADGINMTSLQMKLLEKVEELTLYTLEQQDALSQQRGNIQGLKSKLEEKDAQLLSQQRRIESLEAQLAALLAKVESLPPRR